jgi:hypothetical protein
MDIDKLNPMVFDHSLFFFLQESKWDIHGYSLVFYF